MRAAGEVWRNKYDRADLTVAGNIQLINTLDKGSGNTLQSKATGKIKRPKYLRCIKPQYQERSDGVIAV